MKTCLVILALFIVAVAANEQTNEKPDFHPFSKKMLNYINKMGKTWKVIYILKFYFKDNIFYKKNIKFKAEKSKFHEMPMNVIKGMMGVPLNALEPTLLPEIDHVIPDNLPSIILLSN